MLVTTSPQKEIMIPTIPTLCSLPAPLSCPQAGHPQDTLCVNPKMGICAPTLTHTSMHTHAQSDALLDRANWPFPTTLMDREGYDHLVGRGQTKGLESPENSQHPSRLQAARQFAFPWPPLSLPLRRPYLQGECESLERRKPFGDARLRNNFASESKLVFGVNPSVETLG